MNPVGTRDSHSQPTDRDEPCPYKGRRSAVWCRGQGRPRLPDFLRTGVNPVPTRAQNHVGTPLVGVRPLGQRPARLTHGQGKPCPYMGTRRCRDSPCGCPAFRTGINPRKRMNPVGTRDSHSQPTDRVNPVPTRAQNHVGTAFRLSGFSLRTGSRKRAASSLGCGPVHTGSVSM